MKKPLFIPTSNEKPELLTISFEDDPQGSLGAQLINCDKVRHCCETVFRFYTECKKKNPDVITHYMFFSMPLDFFVDIIFLGRTIRNVFSGICTGWASA